MKNTVFIYGVITLIIFVVLWAVLKKIGLWPNEPTKAEKETADAFRDEIQKQKDLKESELWEPDTLNNVSINDRMSESQAENLAEEIYKSLQWWNDDEDRIYAAFRMIPNRYGVSSIAYYYNKNYGLDLLGDLRDSLNSIEMRYIWDIIQGKPKHS